MVINLAAGPSRRFLAHHDEVVSRGRNEANLILRRPATAFKWFCDAGFAFTGALVAIAGLRFFVCE